MDALHAVNPLMQLINLDAESLLGSLIWGNFATAIIIFLYEHTSKYKFNFSSIFHNMAIVRFLSAFGYFCLFLRGNISNLISVNLGNTVLFLCYFMEYKIIMESTNIYNKKMKLFGVILVLFSIILFNTVEFIYQNPSLRICAASGIIFLFFFPSAVLLLTKSTSKFEKAAGIFYIPLLIALIPRFIEGLTGKITNVVSNTYYQSLVFGSLALLMISNSIIYLLFVKEKKDIIIEKLAKFDSLTNLMNRNNFFFAGNEFFEDRKKHKRCISMLFLDIDFFKKINDSYGHQFGDEVLVKFATTIKNNTRPSDICCRYGGEEFIVLIDTNEEACKNISNRILKETEKISFNNIPDFHITTSIGCLVGVPQPEETLDDFIAKSDKALYKAKRDGRNRIIFYTDDLLL